jgi:phosphopantothenoylcysteine decarboxylase/phosphopantothenate--cysteine ligase
MNLVSPSSIPSSFWHRRRIVVGICGGIAAYKVAGLVSMLAQQGAEVRVMLTGSAQAFVSPLTFATLARHKAYSDADFWHPSQGRPLHIELGEWADAILIAPLSAHTLGKLAGGLADNLLTNVILASTCPVLLAPAMNSDMWRAVAVQRNWRQVQEDPRFWCLMPGEGRLACDVVGPGRMAEPEMLASALMAMLWTQGSRDGRDQRVLISGGGTRDPIDQVRFIGNPSSGRMGWALAQAAVWRGAAVTWVHGEMGFEPMGLDDYPITRIPVVTSAQMEKALEQEFPHCDILLMAAAVGDVRPSEPYSGKLAKKDLPQQLELEPVPDLVAGLASQKQAHQRVLGFAAQTFAPQTFAPQTFAEASQDPVALAQAKLKAKHLDAIVLNPIDQPQRGFGSTTNEAILIGADGSEQRIPLCTKAEMAHHLLDWVWK